MLGTHATDLSSSCSYSGDFLMCYLFQIMDVNLFQVVPALAKEPTTLDSFLVFSVSLCLSVTAHLSNSSDRILIENMKENAVERG